MKSLFTVFATVVLLACVACVDERETPPTPTEAPPVATSAPEATPVAVPIPVPIPVPVAACCQVSADACASGLTVTEEVCTDELSGTWNLGTRCNPDTGACE